MKQTAIINDAINFPQVRLIGSAGEQIGIVKTEKAKELAASEGLDLVIIASESTPPVAKIRDQKKFLYEEKIKRQNSKRSHKNTETKEVRFRLKIDENDFNIKVNSAIKFLKGGDKLKVQVMFRGREIQYPELGVQQLQRVAERLEEFGTIIQAPTHEGRNVTMVMQPNAKKEQTISEQRRHGAETKSRRAERQAKRLAAKGLDASGKRIEEVKSTPKKKVAKASEEKASEEN